MAFARWHNDNPTWNVYFDNGNIVISGMGGTHNLTINQIKEMIQNDNWSQILNEYEMEDKNILVDKLNKILNFIVYENERD